MRIGELEAEIRHDPDDNLMVGLVRPTTTALVEFKGGSVDELRRECAVSMRVFREVEAEEVAQRAAKQGARGS
jgi:predicted HicB family RNase H-like nuclease